MTWPEKRLSTFWFIIFLFSISVIFIWKSNPALAMAIGEDMGGADATALAERYCAVGEKKCGFVFAHNRVRKNAKPSPSPELAEMKWSTDVESAALIWARNCSFSHDTRLNVLNMGQNIFASTFAHSAEDAVAAWADEAEDYDYSLNQCATGKVCGHYTQIVWRNSLRVGCATVTCLSNSPWKRNPWYLTVCNYAEPGNWLGKKPY